MCFNISISIGSKAIEQQFNVKFHIDFPFEPKKHISAFSNPQIPVITSDNQHIIHPCYWGLIPHWTTNQQQAEKIRKMTYNAKSETIKDKPSFRDSIKNKKCLILANGFYEWQTTKSKKTCYYITRPEKNIFAFAGIWSDWVDKSSGELFKSVSILTQPANKIMAEIHNIKKRQPVILNNKHHNEWLNSELEYKYIIDASYNINLKIQRVDSPLKQV